MFEALVRDRLTELAGDTRLFRRVLKVVGRTESHVEEASQPLYSVWRTEPLPIETTILAAPGQVELHLTVTAPDPAAAGDRLSRAVEALVGALGRDVFSTDGRSMEEVVGDLLRARAVRIGVGESCTGGLIASRLTDVPGSSAYVLGSAVTYANDAKTALLGVPADLIAAHGAVSEPVAAAMAAGARRVFGADIGVSATGIAGPDGGSDAKPIGTVCIAVADAAGASHVRTLQLFGNRQMIKFQTAQAALDFVRRILGG
jgi:nicotinamide-nucleotide amidase